MITAPLRKEVHSFLLFPVRKEADLWQHSLTLGGLLSPCSITVTPWTHPVLLDSGIDLIKVNQVLRLIITRKGYRTLGHELESLQVTLASILDFIKLGEV
jgi:hypothetical protein